jgi:hypothetical protein
MEMMLTTQERPPQCPPDIKCRDGGRNGETKKTFIFKLLEAIETFNLLCSFLISASSVMYSANY